jgi:hypothetical protein
MDYALFFASPGAGVTYTQRGEFLTAPPRPVDTRTQRINLPDLGRHFPVRSTQAPARFALQVAKRNFEDWVNALAFQWANETGHLASLSKRRQHPAYRGLVQLGTQVVPLLLERLTTNPDFFFPALREITGANPVRDEDRGYYDRMVSAWQQWGRDRYYL